MFWNVGIRIKQETKGKVFQSLKIADMELKWNEMNDLFDITIWATIEYVNSRLWKNCIEVKYDHKKSQRITKH